VKDVSGKLLGETVLLLPYCDKMVFPYENDLAISDLRGGSRAHFQIKGDARHKFRGDQIEWIASSVDGLELAVAVAQAAPKAAAKPKKGAPPPRRPQARDLEDEPGRPAGIMARARPRARPASRRAAPRRGRGAPAASTVLTLLAAGAAGGILYNVLAPRGIFHPAPLAAPAPLPAPAAAPAPVKARKAEAKRADVAPAPPAPAEIRVIDLAEAKRLLDARGAIFVDARSPIGYEFSHIPGALNLPFSDFEAAYAREGARLPKDAAIVVYCTSGSCDEADITLAHLKAEGYRRLLHFKDGWNAWELAEYPFEKGPAPK